MRRTGGAAAFLVAVTCALLAGSGAWACTVIASVFAEPGSGTAGTAFDVRGHDFVPRAVEVRWGSTDGALLGTAMGPDFEVRVTVPDVPPGDYHVFAVTEGYQASAFFRVMPSPATTTTTPSTTTSPSSSDVPASNGSSSEAGTGSTGSSTPTGDDSHAGTSTTSTAAPAAGLRASSGGLSSTSSPQASTTSAERGAQPSPSSTTTSAAVQVEGAAVVAEPPPQPGPVTTVADVPPVRLLQAGLSSSGSTDNDDGPLSPFLLVGAVALVAGATSVVVRRRRTSGARNTSS